MHFLPDPDDEEVKRRREGCDGVGVGAHHLKHFLQNTFVRFYLWHQGSHPEEGSE